MIEIQFPYDIMRNIKLSQLKCAVTKKPRKIRKYNDSRHTKNTENRSTERRNCNRCKRNFLERIEKGDRKMESLTKTTQTTAGQNIRMHGTQYISFYTNVIEVRNFR